MIPFSLHSSVTAVIPTRGTERCVLDAVESVVGQTRPVQQIVVVADGECRPDVADVLRAKGVTLEILPQRRGANAARQRGVEIAQSQLVAFLDDDDQWAAAKIERQLELLATCRSADVPVLYTAVIGRRGRQIVTRPTRLPKPGQRVQEYLFVRRDFSPGSAFLSTSTLLTAAELVRAVPFDAAVPRHQDWDWIIRAQAAYEGRLCVQVHPDPLTNIRLDHAHGITASTDWKSSFQWARSVRQHLTPREYADLLMVVSGSIAGRHGSGEGLLSIAREAYRHGTPSWRAALTFCGFAVAPAGMRRWFATVRPR